MPDQEFIQNAADQLLNTHSRALFHLLTIASDCEDREMEGKIQGFYRLMEIVADGTKPFNIHNPSDRGNLETLLKAVLKYTNKRVVGTQEWINESGVEEDTLALENIQEEKKRALNLKTDLEGFSGMLGIGFKKGI